MFGFAQFAHLLPYILLAITSFVGLTGYTLNYNQNKAEKEVSSTDVKEVTVESSAKTQKTAEFKYVDTRADIETKCIAFQASQVLNESPPGYSVFYLSNILCLNTFQRPPPNGILS